MMNFFVAEPSRHSDLVPHRLPTRVSGRRIFNITLLIALYIAFTWLFKNIVSTRYAFGSFILSPRGDSSIEIAVVALTGLILSTHPKKISELFAWLSTVFLLVPSAVLSAQQGSERFTMLSMFCSVWSVLLVVRILSCLTPSILRSLRISPVSINFRAITAIIAVALLAVAVQVKGRLNFSFADVYEFRFVFNENLTFPLNYLLPFAAGPLAGLATASALHKIDQGERVHLMLLMIFVFGALFFGFSSHKAFLFYPAFVTVIYFAAKTGASHLYIFGLMFTLTFFTSVSFGTEFSDVFGSTFANRLIFIPAQIHYFFFREFAVIGPQWWAESRVSFGFSQSDLFLPSVNYIALVMTNDPSIGANTGWIANGYMNAGLLGIAFYGVILSGTLHVIDSLGERYGHHYVTSAFVIPIFNIINSTDLLVGYLTGGLLLLFLTFFGFVRPLRDQVQAVFHKRK